MKFNASPSTDGPKNILKLKDKEIVYGILRGEIYEFYTLWDEGKKSQVVAEGTKGARFRFRVNIIVKDEVGANVAKIFEQGAVVYNELKNLNGEYDLEKTVLKITRTGSDKNSTSYSIIPTQKPVDDKAISKVELQNLRLESEAPFNTTAPPPFDSNEEIPF